MSSSSRAAAIDVNGMLREASTPLSVDQLLWSGVRRLRVISPEKMDELINRSVRTIVDKYRLAPQDEAPSVQQMEKESKAEFKELVDQYKQTADAASAVERSKQALEEVRLELDPGSPGAETGPGCETWMLRKRVEKLTAHIATMETALKTLSSTKGFSNQHVQNILRDLGLAQEDKHFEKKKEMLQVVLGENQDIRRKAGELAARGISLSAPEGTKNSAGICPPISAASTRRSA